MNCCPRRARLSSELYTFVHIFTYFYDFFIKETCFLSPEGQDLAPNCIHLLCRAARTPLGLNKDHWNGHVSGFGFLRSLRNCFFVGVYFMVQELHFVFVLFGNKRLFGMVCGVIGLRFEGS